MILKLNVILIMLIIPKFMANEILKSDKLTRKLNYESAKRNNISKESKDVGSNEELEDDLSDEEVEGLVPNSDKKEKSTLFKKRIREKHLNDQIMKNYVHSDEDEKKLEISTHKYTEEKNTDEKKYQYLEDLHVDNDRASVNKEKSSVIDMKQSHLEDYTIVTDVELFPFMVAVMKGAAYLCAGALIDENWVITAADKMFMMRDTIRFLRVRLGSVNYKKGGELLPVKYLEIHPYFDQHKPTYDIALLMLSKPVRYTPSLRSIRLQLMPKEVTTTHFIVSSWSGALKNKSSSTQTSSLRRMLTMSHLHPLDPEECADELQVISARHDGVMCLETGLDDACTREVGAPVVTNGVLWAVISSWKTADCDKEDTPPVFAVQMSAKNISTWIRAVVRGLKWHPKTER